MYYMRPKAPRYKIALYNARYEIEEGLKAAVRGIPGMLRAIPGLLLCTLVLMMPLIAFVLMNV